MGNTPSSPQEMLNDKIDYVFEHFGQSRDSPPDVKKSAATWNKLGWSVFFHNAAMAEDYALSPHALAAAYLSLSAAVTSATAAEDGKVHLTAAGRELCVGVHLPIIFEEGGGNGVIFFSSLRRVLPLMMRTRFSSEQGRLFGNLEQPNMNVRRTVCSPCRKA